MKYCYACGHRTRGEPLFCNFCGRSYDVKLCPKLHVNPRSAEACSQCGSRDLSIPQPRIPLLWPFVAALTQAVFGFFLLTLSLSVSVSFLYDLSRLSLPLDCLFVGPRTLDMLQPNILPSNRTGGDVYKAPSYAQED